MEPALFGRSHFLQIRAAGFRFQKLWLEDGRMSRKASEVVVLCEDSQHRVFLYRMLKRSGISSHRIRVENARPGVGSAEQFVRDRYPIEVKAHRSAANSLEVRLIVMIDADSYTFQQRQRQLASSLRDDQVERRAHRECIAILIPRRNIETWIHSLKGALVDETTLYPKFHGNEKATHPAVDRLLGHLQTGVPASLPDSLKRGCKELKQRLLDCQYR